MVIVTVIDEVGEGDGGWVQRRTRVGEVLLRVLCTHHGGRVGNVIKEAADKGRCPEDETDGHTKPRVRRGT